jgi:hypothetical protein
MAKKILLASLVIGLASVLTACQTPAQKTSEKTAEKIAEKALEKSTGGKADVDIKNKQVNVQTNEGSLQTGENVSLPADFPSDVYVIEGTIKAVILNNKPKGYTVSLETDQTVSDVKTAYEEKIAADGWATTGIMDFGGTVSIAGEKDNRTLSVIISASEGEEKTSIVLGVAEKNE